MAYKDDIDRPEWQKKRLEIFQRDDFKCQICGSDKRKLHVHHLYYLPGLKAWEYDNEALKTVCDQHHEQLTKDLPKLAGLIAWEILIGKRQVP